MRMTNVMVIEEILALKKREKRKRKTSKLNRKLIVSLQWCPSKGNPRHELVIHNGFDPGAIPISGDQSPDIYFLPSRRKLNLRRYWPNLKGKLDKLDDDISFLESQWVKHGSFMGVDPCIYFQRLTPRRHLQVKDVRRSIKEKFNAAPEVHIFIRSRGLVRCFAIEEHRFEVDEGNNLLTVRNLSRVV
ncbi:hypothetical protein OROMI_016031 [Orobanche minor]